MSTQQPLIAISQNTSRDLLHGVVSLNALSQNAYQGKNARIHNKEVTLQTTNTF
jgi:hypothetical protein